MGDSKVKHIKTVNEYERIMNENSNSNVLIVADFSATWCPPCRAIAPVYEKMSTEHPDVIFLHIDVDELADLPEVQDVSGVPTFKFFKNGNKLSEFAGAVADKIRDTIAKFK